jgi:hypothetical protein
MRAFLFALLSAGAMAQTLDNPPLPDVRALFAETAKNQKSIDERTQQYTFHLTTEEAEVDSKGEEKSRTTEEFEIYYAAGHRIGRLIARNGLPLTGKDKMKADDEFNKKFGEAGKKQAELDRDPKKQDKHQIRVEAGVSDFLRAEQFINPRWDSLGNQRVVAFDFDADPAYKPKSAAEHLVQSLAGTAWIDDGDKEVVRMEAHFDSSFKALGGVFFILDRGSKFVFEQARINNEVWLPSYSEFHASGRFFGVRWRESQTMRFSDYKKFRAESRFVAAGE